MRSELVRWTQVVVPLLMLAACGPQTAVPGSAGPDGGIGLPDASVSPPDAGDGDAGTDAGTDAGYERPPYDLPPICFTQVAPLPRGVIAPSAVLLQDGRVLVVGGVFVNTARIYDPDADAWTDVAPMHVARLTPAVAVLQDGRVLVAGGRDWDYGWERYIFLDSAEIFDPRTGEWTDAAPMSAPRPGALSHVLPDGRVLVTFSNRADAPIAEVYDPRKDAWTTLKVPTDPATLHFSVQLPDGRIYFDGRPDSFIYDPRTDRWEKAPARSGTASTYLVPAPGGSILAPTSRGALGGELMDPATGQWQPTSPFTVAREYGLPAEAADGRPMVFGGLDPRTSYNVAEVEAFDPDTRAWTLAGRMALPRWDMALVRLRDGRILVIGGSSYWNGRDTAPKSVEAWDPACARSIQ